MLYNTSTTEDTISVTRYERAHRIEMSNPLDGIPQLMFVTSWVERDNETGIETQKENHRSISDVVVDPSEEFDVYDRDGNLVMKAKYGEVAGVLYSLFFHVANKVDG